MTDCSFVVVGGGGDTGRGVSEDVGEESGMLAE